MKPYIYIILQSIDEMTTVSVSFNSLKAQCPQNRRRSSAQRGYKLPKLRVVSEGSTTAKIVEEKRQLGKSALTVSTVGIGAWSWGDRSGYWGYNKGYGKTDNLTAYEATLKNGIDFIDTAEVYGFGLSEEFLRDFMRQTDTQSSVKIATKFAPLPWRQTPDSLVGACKASLNRLGLEKMALYIQHWPGFFFNAFANDAYLEGLARVAELDLATAVGVSNFNVDRVRKAATKLESRGTCLSSNQVQYSLLYRAPETNGVLEACKETGTTLVAYSPLAQGLLTGKYDGVTTVPTGPRASLFKEGRYSEIVKLLDLMKVVGAEHGGKTPTQVAVNWTMCKGALPIPGGKNEKQVEEIAGALGWRLTDGEMAELDAVSGKIPSSTGAPFEKW